MTLSARDDASLVASALAGEDRAFSELMRRYGDQIYRFVRRYVGDADEAHDLVQETFVAAWAALADFDVARPMAAWLRRIALNKCRDWSRRRTVRRLFFGATHLEGHGARSVAAVVQADDETQLARLDAAIGALPRTLKEPLLLTTFEGLSHKEAARTLGVSPKAVEMRVYRARQALAKALGEPEEK